MLFVGRLTGLHTSNKLKGQESIQVTSRSSRICCSIPPRGRRWVVCVVWAGNDQHGLSVCVVFAWIWTSICFCGTHTCSSGLKWFSALWRDPGAAEWRRQLLHESDGGCFNWFPTQTPRSPSVKTSHSHVTPWERNPALTFQTASSHIIQLVLDKDDLWEPWIIISKLGGIQTFTFTPVQGCLFTFQTTELVWVFTAGLNRPGLCCNTSSPPLCYVHQTKQSRVALLSQNSSTRWIWLIFSHQHLWLFPKKLLKRLKKSPQSCKVTIITGPRCTPPTSLVETGSVSLV